MHSLYSCNNIFIQYARKYYLKTSISQLHLLECDSKEILRNYGVNIQNFITVTQSDNLKSAIDKLCFKSKEYVIKCQILAGGRYLGIFDNGYKGGVHIATKSEDIQTITKSMLGHRLITKQTSKLGSLVTKVMIAECIKIRKETYLSIMLDRTNNGPVIVASPNGGIDIENSCETVEIFPIDINVGVTKDKTIEIATYLGFHSKLHKKVMKQIDAIWNAFIKTDALVIEINPFVETEDDEIFAVDAKINFDDNALFRQDQISMFGEKSKEEMDELERKANKLNLNYIRLDGNIGCLVNGAGLAMATMDVLKLYGGEPANFLDVGGGVSEEQVSDAVKILLSDVNVESILINIFGGIVDCKIIANGIKNALTTSELHVPLIIILRGNNFEDAKNILCEFDKDMRIVFADNLHEAAQLAVGM